MSPNRPSKRSEEVDFIVFRRISEQVYGQPAGVLDRAVENGGVVIDKAQFLLTASFRRPPGSEPTRRAELSHPKKFEGPDQRDHRCLSFSPMLQVLFAKDQNPSGPCRSSGDRQLDQIPHRS